MLSRRVRTVLFLTGVSLSAVALAGGYSVAAATPSNPLPPTVSPHPPLSVTAKPVHTRQTLTAAELQADAARNLAETSALTLDTFGATHYPTTYGGSALSNDGAAVTVYLTTPDAGTEAALQAQSPTPLTFAATLTTEQERRALTDQLTTAWPTLRQQGYHLVKGVEDVAAGTETLQLMHPTPAQITALTAQFGPHLTIQAVGPDQQVFATSRSQDNSPWYGGDWISDSYYPSVYAADCTSGIPVHNKAGGQYLITASHCFPLGDKIYNYSSTIPTGSGTMIGTLPARDNRAGGLDAELVQTTASDGYAWVGASSTSTTAVFAGAGPTAANSVVCVDGAFEGEFCDAVVSSVGQPLVLCVANTGPPDYTCTQSRDVSHVTTATSRSGALIVGSGDSGGPVYQRFGTNIKAVGTITGQSAGPNCTNWSAQTTRKCSSTIYFTDIGPELSLWGLTVQ